MGQIPHDLLVEAVRQMIDAFAEDPGGLVCLGAGDQDGGFQVRRAVDLGSVHDSMGRGPCVVMSVKTTVEWRIKAVPLGCLCDGEEGKEG